MECCTQKSEHGDVSCWTKVRRGIVAACGAMGLAAAAGAQMHKVEAPQKVTRAVGVYEWTGELSKPTAARLVPVTLFIDGHFEDAGVYLARPQPFALQTGIVYEVDQAGKAIGTLNLDYAKDIVTRRSATDDNPLGAWYGYGTFVLPSAAPKPRLQASAHLPVIMGSGHDTVSSDDDGRPHMTRRAGSESGATTGPATTSSTTSSTATPNANSTNNPAPPEDSDRPVLTRRQDNSTGTSSGSTTPSTTTPSTTTTPTPTTGADDPDRPTLRHRDPADNAKPNKHDSGSAVIPLDTSLNNDPNRPVMRRGKPLGEVVVAPLTGVPAELHQAVAVSDAAAGEEHIFNRNWESTAERAETQLALEALARKQVQTYIATNKLLLTDPASQPAPTMTRASSTSSSRTRKATRPPTPLVPLANEQLNGYELTYGGLPTFIYTADMPLFSGGPVYVTMVAQRLPAGNLQVAFSSVTDAAHLDRTPWFRFVDAVDPDGSHRASLLFELRAQSTRQFALYRLITANAEQTFATGIIE
jgi:hypothetical protein